MLYRTLSVCWNACAIFSTWTVQQFLFVSCIYKCSHYNWLLGYKRKSSSWEGSGTSPSLHPQVYEMQMSISIFTHLINFNLLAFKWNLMRKTIQINNPGVKHSDSSMIVRSFTVMRYWIVHCFPSEEYLLSFW